MKLNKRKVKDLKVLVVGDICIDKYFYGSVDRISPEGPIPILNIERTEERLGMAANVALNLKALGANVTICTDLPKDNSFCFEELSKRGIGLATFTTDRNVTYKNRLVANNQILYRFDEEEITNLNNDEEQRLIDWATTNFHEYDAVVISDYGKGFFSEKLASTLVTICKMGDVLCFVDPDVNKSIHTYLDATVVKPNQKELYKWGISLEEFKSSQWFNTFCDYLIVTVGSEGMLCKSDSKSGLIEARIASKTFVDTTGCGDTALAALTIGKALEYNIKDCMKIANAAAGLASLKMGTTQVTLDELNNIL